MFNKRTTADLENRISRLEEENRDLKRKLAKAKQAIRQEVYEDIIREFIVVNPALLNLDEANSRFKRRFAEDEYVTQAIDQFIETFASTLALDRILTPGEVVDFDPKIHAAMKRIAPGTKVCVVRSGWRNPSMNLDTPPLVEQI